MKPFKNIIIYKFNEPFTLTEEQFTTAIAEYPLRECLEQEVVSFGWLPAFSQGENFVEKMNNAYFIRLGMNIKKLSRKAIATEIERRAREHGIDLLDRARYKELEETVTQVFIKKAYPEQSSMMAYIDLEKGWLVVDAATEKESSLLTAVLRKSLGSLPVVGYAPQVDMPTIMTDWVRQGHINDSFGLLDEVEMKELNKDEGGTARYKGIPLDSKEIELNLEEGWSVTRVGLSHEDIVTFSLGQDFIFKRLRYLDQFQEKLELSDDQNAVAQSNAYLLADTVRSLATGLFNACYSKEGVSDE